MFMAKLDKASFESLDMPRTNFRQAYLHDSVITGSDLEASDFSFSKIESSNLVNCSLVEANFEAAVLSYVRLDGVDFTGANLKNCEWIGCSADNVIFTAAITEGFIINGKPFDTNADLEKKEKDIKADFLFFLKNTIMQNEYGKPLCLDKPNSQINDDFKEVLFMLEKCGIQIKQSKSLFVVGYTHFEFSWGDL